MVFKIMALSGYSTNSNSASHKAVDTNTKENSQSVRAVLNSATKKHISWRKEWFEVAMLSKAEAEKYSQKRARVHLVHLSWFPANAKELWLQPFGNPVSHTRGRCMGSLGTAKSF